MSLGKLDAGFKPRSGEVVEWLLLATLLLLVIFCWSSIQAFAFNGLSSPLFLALATFCMSLAIRFRVKVRRQSLTLYLLWAGWVVYVDAISGDFLVAFARDTHWLLLPIFITLIAELVRFQPITPRIFRLSAAFSIVLILIVYLQNANGVVDWSHPPLFGNIRHFGMTIGFFVVLLSGCGDADKYERAFIKVARVIGLAMLLWSGSRSPTLGWIVAAAILLHLRRGDEPWKSVVAELIVALVLAVLFSPAGSPWLGPLNQFMRSSDLTSLDGVSTGRIALWSKTIEALSHHGLALTGAGGNGFVRLGLYAPGPIFHPHNLLLQMITDWGVVGLFLFCLFVWRSGVARISHSPHGAVVVALIGYVLISGQFDASTYHLEHLIYFSIALGILLAEEPQVTSQSVRLKWSPILPIFFFLTLHIYLFDYQSNWSTRYTDTQQHQS